MFPAKEDLLGKLSYAKAANEKVEELSKSVCYMAYTAFKSRVPLLKSLEKENMKELYADMEMPLLFTLADMEKEGILVEAGALKEYGEKLQIRIEALEKEIWEQAGEEFNINSPNSLE